MAATAGEWLVHRLVDELIMVAVAPNNNHVVGVDLGGTKILAGVFRDPRDCIGKNKISTKPELGPKKVIERISRCVREAVEGCDLSLEQIKGIGIGAPGVVDAGMGRVVFAPNLGWRNIDLQHELESLLGRPVVIENDTNLCTLGVYQAELKNKPRHMLGVFLGTGIGGGLIIDGKLFSGFNHSAGEIGHMVIAAGGPKCGCGNRGCFEALVGRQSLFHRIRAKIKDGEKTLLTEMLGPHLADMRSGDLRKAIRKGDKLVQKVVEDAAEYTGIALANLINIFGPEIVVLGGGIIDALATEMMPIIEETARRYAMSGTDKGVRIISSELGDDAGITGAAVIASGQTL